MWTGRRPVLRRLVVTSLVVVTLAPSPTVAGGQAPAQLLCQRETLPVTLPLPDLTVYHVIGYLCGRGTWSGKTVQVLTPGGSYDHTYWSFPFQPDTYSYTQWATDQGFATFDIDRLGTGQSDLPPAALVTTTSSAYVEHQIVQALRAGAVGGYPAGRVVLVGHSLGSMVSLVEASTYHDVDGVVATGFLHVVDPVGFPQVGATFVPALSAPPGYITTASGTRGPDFYAQSSADPAVIAVDESLKSPESGATLGDMAVSLDPTVTRAITVPVLLVVGDHDKLFCDPVTPGFSCASSADVLARESLDYRSAACLRAVVQASSGHSIALHPHAREGFRAMTDWAALYVGTDPSVPPAQPCTT
jgi:pimeloyl-ACP methyl ester carboxylesterase